MDTVEPNYKDYLKREFRSRISRNKSYSLRSYARDLEIAPPKLSQILNGKCGLSEGSAKKLAKKLKLSDVEADFFVTLVNAKHSRSGAGKITAKSKLRELLKLNFDELDLNRFRIISDWFHFAILELTEVSDFVYEPSWIARRLRIPLAETKAAIKRLVENGLLTEAREGRLIQTHTTLSTPSGIPLREIRNHHSQILSKADVAQDEVALEQRDFATSIFSIDSAQIPEAKKALREFRRRFCTELQKSATKDRVYCLSVQFFPLDQPSNNTKEIL